MDPKRYRLKLKRLDFISAVDQPAQETATVRLIKRGGVEGEAKIVKVEEELGLVFCWAFTSKVDGADYFDLHDDKIDEDFVKACAEFMTGARAVDEMHDGQQTGQVVFAMPMTAEIAKAFGVETDTVGLMIALKPSKEALAKFKSGEYTGVSIAGVGVRESLKAAKPIAKRSVLTTAVDGHTHLIAGVDDMQAGCTSSETMPGSEYGWHSHPWVREGGVITVGEAMGHTHTIASSAAIEMRAPTTSNRIELSDASKSTTANASPNVEPHTPTEAIKMDPKDEQIATLTKRSDALSTMLGLLVALPTEQRDHVAKLAPTALETFLGKSATDRAAEVAAAIAADPVEYTTKSGVPLRRSHGQLAIEQAKQIDAMGEELAKSKADGALARLEKRAGDEIPFLKGETAVKVAVLRALDGIADEKIRGEAVAMLKGANVAMAELAKATGANPGNATDNVESPIAKFNEKLAEFAKTANKAPAHATADFIRTSEGANLYAAAYPRVRE
jgi:hypothetical protein